MVGDSIAAEPLDEELAQAPLVGTHAFLFRYSLHRGGRLQAFQDYFSAPAGSGEKHSEEKFPRRCNRMPFSPELTQE